MIKIGTILKRAAVVSGVTGAVILGSTVSASAATPAGATPAVASSAGAAQGGGPITTQGVGDCTYILEYIGGYEITTTRYALCSAAALPLGSAGTRIAVCSAGMAATGVWGGIALPACTAATG